MKERKQARFPTRTARVVTVAGQEIWMKTLNGPEMSEVSRHADWAAMRELMQISPGTEQWDILSAKYRRWTTSQRVTHLLEEFEFRKLLKRLSDRFPELPEPDRGDLDNKKYAEAIKKWETTEQKKAEQRVEFRRDQLEREQTRLDNLSEDDQVKECINAELDVRYNDIFSPQQTHGIIYYACRAPGDRYEHFFADLQEVVELDDEVRFELIREYNGLDTLRPEDIPTSPGSP